MAFQNVLSLATEPVVRSRGGNIPEGSVYITQSNKNKEGREYIHIRLAPSLIEDSMLKIGDRVELLYDDESETWLVAYSMEEKSNQTYKLYASSKAVVSMAGNLKLSLRDGMPRIGECKENQRLRCNAIKDSIKTTRGKIYFKIKRSDAQVA